MTPAVEDDHLRQLRAVADRRGRGGHGDEDEDRDHESLGRREDEISHKRPRISPFRCRFDARRGLVAGAGRSAAADDVGRPDRTPGRDADAQPQGECATGQRVGPHPGTAARYSRASQPCRRQQPLGPDGLDLPVQGVVAPGDASGRTEENLRVFAYTTALQGCELDDVGALDHQLMWSLVAYQIVSHAVLRVRRYPTITLDTPDRSWLPGLGVAAPPL